jgi:hypothetical protein
MNAVEAILTQIRAIADRITGPEGYSLDSLRAVATALRNASERLDNEIALRVASADYSGDAS